MPRGRAWKTGKGSAVDAELFNLRTDPAEQHNLAAALPDRVRRMQAQLSAILGK